MRLIAQGASCRCQRTSRSWPTELSSHGSLAISTTMISMRYVPVKPASRPAAENSPPGAPSEPRDPPRMTAARTAPKPSPASAAHTSTITGRGAGAGRGGTLHVRARSGSWTCPPRITAQFSPAKLRTASAQLKHHFSAAHHAPRAAPHALTAGPPGAVWTPAQTAQFLDYISWQIQYTDRTLVLCPLKTATSRRVLALD